MKIAIVAPYYAPHIGGVESHVHDVAKYLVDQGDDVTVLTSRYDKHLPRFERREGIVVRRVVTPVEALRTPFMPRVHQEILDGDWEIIHSHTPPPFTAYFACTAANAKGTPHVLTYHADDMITLPALGPVLVALYRESLGRYVLAHSDQVVVSTESYARTSRLVWRYDPKVIGATIDAERFNPMVDGSKVRKHLRIPPPDEGHMVMYVGRLVPHKGVEFLLEALPMLRDTAHLVVVGVGPWRETLEERAVNMGIADRVTFAGAVPFPELPHYYRAADVTVLPSISRLEAFGLVGLEAMASERPVVLSDIPGVREVIEDGREGLLAGPVDPEDLAEKINTLLDDPVLRHKMGQRGRKRVLEHFTISVVGKQFRDIYVRLLEQA
jgi:glycosyltransferase involved in cell wall biosynthesis